MLGGIIGQMVLNVYALLSVHGEGWVLGTLTKMKGKDNPAFGRCWWNNGVEQKYCKECPGDGYVKGMLKRK